MAVKEGKYMIIHGGKTSLDGLKEIFLQDLWAFDMLQLTWTEIKIKNMQLQRAFHDGCIYKKKLLFFGGKYSNKFCHRDPNSFYEIELFNDQTFDTKVDKE